jgi:hypothetical protein
MEHLHGSGNKLRNAIYTCPMHPEIKQDKPGNCPKCGMTLVLAKPDDKKDIPISGTSIIHPWAMRATIIKV